MGRTGANEYANDVNGRVILGRVAAAAGPRPGDTLRQWLRPVDERYEAATVRAAKPFHGHSEQDHPYPASEWHWRILAVWKASWRRTSGRSA